MADPGKESPFEAPSSAFSPAELDRLEDALERWTGPTASDDGDLEPVPEDSSLAPHLRARLEDYRSLLALTRAELPMEDVPDALLAGVLAEAHAGARPTTRPVTRRELVAAGPSLWERLRRSMLLPGVALAGSAMLLLWVVQPGDSAPELAAMDRSEAASEPTAQTPAKLALEATPAPAAAEAPKLERGLSEETRADAKSVAQDAAPAQPPGAAPTDAIGEDVLKDMSEAKPDRKGKAKKSVSSEPVEVYPGLDDAPLAEGNADKEALRDSLELANVARRKNHCGEALELYKEAMPIGAPTERAQAYAGYGLCLMALGKDAAADKYFEHARKLSPSVDAWIQRERGDSPSRKSPAKPSAKAKMDSPGD